MTDADLHEPSPARRAGEPTPRIPPAPATPPVAPGPAAATPAPAGDATMSPSLFGAGARPADAPPPDLREAVIDVLMTCFDPEIPVNIYDLGLIYGIDVSPENAVTVRMTLTSPSCPVAGTLPPEVEQKVRAVPGVASARVELVWEPPWGKHLLSEAARLQLGLDGYY